MATTLREFGSLTRLDLRAFDRHSTDLIMKMIDHGWEGRVSQRGHAILRAPDGTTTASVSRDHSNGQTRRNAEAAWNRWLREQSAFGEAATPTAPVLHAVAHDERPVPNACPQCGRPFASAPALAGHMQVHNPLVDCPICGLSVKSLGQHNRWKHPAPEHTLEELIAEVEDHLVLPEPEEPHAPAGATWDIAAGAGLPSEPDLASVAQVNDEPVIPEAVVPPAPPAPVSEPVVKVVEIPAETPPTIGTLEAMESLLLVMGEVEQLRAENRALRDAIKVLSK
jgi:hypothetical protein